MKKYEKPLLDSLDIYIQDVILSSVIEKVDDIFDLGDVSDEYLQEKKFMKTTSKILILSSLVLGAIALNLPNGNTSFNEYAYDLDNNSIKCQKYFNWRK